MGEAGKRIGDIFYETRVLMGREYSQRRFAEEVLGGCVDPAMLGFVEKGQRFPTEAQVRRLAAVRKEDPRELLALLWRDRIVYAFARELKGVLHVAPAVHGIEDAALSVLVSMAVAALPDDGSWRPLDKWRRTFRAPARSRRKRAPVPHALAAQVEATLREQQIVEVRGRRVRRIGKHFSAKSPQERQSMAIEFCGLFTKALLDMLALQDAETGTYLRTHFLNMNPAKIPEFHRRLDEALTALREEFAEPQTRETRLKNVLVAATRS